MVDCRWNHLIQPKLIEYHWFYWSHKRKLKRIKFTSVSFQFPNQLMVKRKFCLKNFKNVIFLIEYSFRIAFALMLKLTKNMYFNVKFIFKFIFSLRHAWRHQLQIHWQILMLKINEPFIIKGLCFKASKQNKNLLGDTDLIQFLNKQEPYCRHTRSWTPLVTNEY